MEASGAYEGHAKFTGAEGDSKGKLVGNCRTLCTLGWSPKYGEDCRRWPSNNCLLTPLSDTVRCNSSANILLVAKAQTDLAGRKHQRPSARRRQCHPSQTPPCGATRKQTSRINLCGVMRHQHP